MTNTMYDLPVSVEIDGKKHNIRNQCDYRVVLDCFAALNDPDLPEQSRFECALIIFYENVEEIEDIQTATEEMCRILNYDQPQSADADDKPALMDWNFDFPILSPAVNRVLGYDIRTPGKYTHWYTLMGAYMEIGESYFSNIVSIRAKKAKKQKFEKWEREFYNENRDKIDLPVKLSEEEKAALEEPW